MRLAQRQQQRALSFAEALLFRNNRYHALTSNGNARRQAALCERPPPAPAPPHSIAPALPAPSPHRPTSAYLCLFEPTVFPTRRDHFCVPGRDAHDNSPMRPALFPFLRS